jgi:hypothetical protein
MTLLARLMSKREGFGIPGAVPTRDHNPLDLRHSPHSSHEGEGSDDIGIIDTDADGWADAERQLQRWAAEGLTLAQAIAIDAPPTENDTAAYLKFVCDGGVWSPETLVSEALKTP